METSHICTKVTLRKRPISKGRISLYLDFYPAIRNPYTFKMTRREYLGIYIMENPQDELQRHFNAEMLEKAEAIRCLRQTSLINEQFGFLDRTKSKTDCLPYFKQLCQRKGDKWIYTYKHFERFTNNQCRFGELTVEFCNKFYEYLENTNQLGRTHMKINRNSASEYWSTFRAMLKRAYKDKYLQENINDFLERMKKEEVRKEFLTLAEVKKLARTKCQFPALKAASLFSCLTGLRISDVMNLKWENIRPAQDGGYCIVIRTQKTSTMAILPISQEAYELCGTPDTGKVFKGLIRSMTQQPLKDWIKKAGITKHITFHCFRHTYATLQLAAGTDIYTVSKMLTHKNVATTQIYAELVSEKKRMTVDKIKIKED